LRIKVGAAAFLCRVRQYRNAGFDVFMVIGIGGFSDSKRPMSLGLSPDSSLIFVLELARSDGVDEWGRAVLPRH